MTDSNPTPSQIQLRNLVVMAFADGSLGQREVDLVAQRCVDLNLSEKDLQEALKFGMGESAAITLPGSLADKRELMSDLVRMMAADGHLDEGEKQLFALCAARMDLNADELDEIVDSALKSSGSE